MVDGDGLRSVFEALPFPCVLLDTDLVITEVSGAYTTTTGRSRQELVGRYLFDAFPLSSTDAGAPAGADGPDDAAAGPADPLTLVRASMQRVLATGQADPVPLQKYDIADPGSPAGFSERWWSFTTFPLTAAGSSADATEPPRVSGLLHVTEDVTAEVVRTSGASAQGAEAVAEQVQRSTALLRGRAQQLEADLYARAVQVQGLVAAREEAAARLSGLASSALALSEARSVAELADRITDHGLAVTGCDSGAVAVFAADEPTMMDLTITDGFGAATQRDYSRLPVASHLPACVAARTGEVVLLADAAASLAWGTEMEGVMASTGSQAFACLPLMADDRPIGSLTAGWRQPQSFDTDQVQLLSAFAVQCAQVLQRLQVAEAERAAARAAVLSAERQAALVAIAQALAAADSRDDVLDVLDGKGRALLGANGCGLCLRSSAGTGGGDVIDTIVTDAYAEVRHTVQRAPADFPLPAIRSAATGAEIFLPDRATTEAAFPGSEAVYVGAGVQASAALPLHAQGELLGCLSVGFAEPRAWTGAEQELLRAFAALTAQALQRLHASDAERAATASQAALVAVAQALGAAEDEDAVLAVVAGRGLELLDADGSGLGLLDDGAVRVLGTASIHADVRARVRRLPHDFPLPVVHTAATGEPHFFSDRESTAARFPGAEELYATAGLQASATVPLHLRERLLGSLSVASSTVREWSSQQRELLEAFASMTAQALDRVAARDGQLRAARETTAAYATLQESMLTDPPEPDHMQIVVRYRPAAVAAQVGGDWYDALLQPDGGTRLLAGGAGGAPVSADVEAQRAATVLVIGDVVGHDTLAAAAMGQIRTTLRTIAVDGGRGPAAVLAATDAALPALMVPTTATAVVARLEQTPEQRRRGQTLLRWSNAGHLPPVVIDDDGTVRELPSGEPDLLLGLFPEFARHESVVVLDRGATLLLYTDGLVERRGESLEVGLARLREVLAELHSPSPEAHDPGGPGLDALVDELLERMVPDRPEDDVALIAVRLHPQDRPRPSEAGPRHLPEHVVAE